MMKYLQRLGKSLMLPVACLPAAGILMGIAYWIDPAVMQGGDTNAIALYLLKAGNAIIDNMAILFTVGVALGMSDDNDGTAILAGVVSWLIVQQILKPDVVAALMGGIPVESVNAAFGKANNQFIGIICGLVGSSCYNKFKNTKLPDALAFFSGKRCVSIVTAVFSMVLALILFFVWPTVYTALVNFGMWILGFGGIGAGLYAFFNRLLIPIGLHHALNSVFWFDVAGINDIGRFWAGTGTLGVTGMYMTGFFPVMMYGLPAASLAMYHTAKTTKKKATASLLLAASVCAFFTGVTEPLEFAFMFLAPGLYLIHAVLTGISVAICAFLPVRSGFYFSAGFVDWFFSFKAPMAVNPWLLIPIGLVTAAVYYVVFRFSIITFKFKTPGREDDDIDEEKVTLSNSDFTAIASTILEGLGGKENVKSVDNCITRLRLEIVDYTKVDEKKIKSAGIAGIIRPSKTAIQVIVGTKVQFVADEMKKLVK